MSASPKHPTAPDARGAHSLHRFVGSRLIISAIIVSVSAYLASDGTPAYIVPLMIGAWMVPLIFWLLEGAFRSWPNDQAHARRNEERT
jgi:hypothetical protein